MNDDLMGKMMIEAIKKDPKMFTKPALHAAKAVTEHMMNHVMHMPTARTKLTLETCLKYGSGGLEERPKAVGHACLRMVIAMEKCADDLKRIQRDYPDVCKEVDMKDYMDGKYDDDMNRKDSFDEGYNDVEGDEL